MNPKFSGFPTMSNFMTRPVKMMFLRPSSRGRTLLSAFGSQLLPGCFTPSGFAGSQLCRSHGREITLPTPLLLRLELGELEAAQAMESEGWLRTAQCFSLSLAVLWGHEVQRAQRLNLPWSLPWTTALGPDPGRAAPQKHPALSATAMGAFLSSRIRCLGSSLPLRPFQLSQERVLKATEWGEHRTPRGEFPFGQEKPANQKAASGDSTGRMREASKDETGRECH